MSDFGTANLACVGFAGRGSLRWPLLVSVCALIAITGCGNSRSSGRLDQSAGQDLPILWQKSGTYSRITRVLRVVARDRPTLAQLPIAEVPVDFDSQMVLVVGLGLTPGNELGVRIARVWQEGSYIRVQERRIHPGTEHALGLEPASPWTIAVVPKSDLNVEGFLTRVPPGALGEHAGAR